MRALRDAALAGVLALGLFLPLIGLRTVQNMRNELELDTRWPLLFTFVAIVVGGRLAYALVVAPWRARRAARPYRPSAFTPGTHRSRAVKSRRARSDRHRATER